MSWMWDVVSYRDEFLAKMSELDARSISPFLTPPTPVGQEKPLIRVMHDESTFYSSADQTEFWGDGHVQCLAKSP